jgi:hypothetical protein
VSESWRCTPISEVHEEMRSSSSIALNGPVELAQPIAAILAPLQGGDMIT